MLTIADVGSSNQSKKPDRVKGGSVCWASRALRVTHSAISSRRFRTLAAVALSHPTDDRHVSLLGQADFALSPAAERFVEIQGRDVGQ